MEKNISRRKFLTMGLVAAASCLMPSRIMAALTEPDHQEKTLCLYNPFSKENMEITYWKDGNYKREGLDRINYMFRDIHTGSIKKIDKKLLDLLFNVQQELDIKEPFHIVSGYRTPRSNAKLLKKKKVVSRRSLHIYGKAVDIQVPGHKIREIRKAAMKLKAGGVGYYPRAGTLHLDVGPVRYWRG